MIPDRAHFVWLNSELPWVNLLALSSASRHGGFSKVVLHHDQQLPLAALAELERIENLELRRLDARALLLEPALGLGAAARERLCARYLRLRAPAAKSNLLRVALLAAEGGVYLDMDTVTVRELRPLCVRASAFCGVEHVAFPALARHGRPAFASFKGSLRAALRGVLARAPRGFRVFPSVAFLYPLAANNAVLGSQPEHPLMLELLERMAALPESEAQRRFALGTHLLQVALRERQADDVLLLPPAAFYPLGPVLSQQWFRYTARPALAEVVTPQTLVVHWYASLRTQKKQRELCPATVARDAPRQLFSALVSELGLTGPMSTKKTSPIS